MASIFSDDVTNVKYPGLRQHAQKSALARRSAIEARMVHPFLLLAAVDQKTREAAFSTLSYLYQKEQAQQTSSVAARGAGSQILHHEALTSELVDLGSAVSKDLTQLHDLTSALALRLDAVEKVVPLSHAARKALKISLPKVEGARIVFDPTARAVQAAARSVDFGVQVANQSANLGVQVANQSAALGVQAAVGAVGLSGEIAQAALEAPAAATDAAVKVSRFALKGPRQFLGLAAKAPVVEAVVSPAVAVAQASVATTSHIIQPAFLLTDKAVDATESAAKSGGITAAMLVQAIQKLKKRVEAM